MDGNYLDKKTKTAVATVSTALINADGVVFEKELECLDTVKRKYKITTTHLKDANTMSLAKAVECIIMSSAINDGSAVGSNLGKVDFEDFMSDMEKLAKAGCVGEYVSHDKAMILLAMRYAYGFAGVHIFEYAHRSIKFAKREVIYIDDNHTGSFLQHHDENEKYFDSLSSMLASWGFQYVDVQTVQNQLSGYTAEFMKRTIEYLYPSQATDNVVNLLYDKITNNDARAFGSQVMQEGTGLTEFPPSLLFKIGESRVVSDCGANTHTMFNMLQVPIKDGYRIEDTIQNFIRKYRDLVGSVNVECKYGKQVSFKLRGFQKTLLDFYFALDKEPNSLLIQIKTGKKSYRHLKFGNMIEVSLSRRQAAYYLLIVYLSKAGKPFLHDDPFNTHTPRWLEHQRLFKIISDAIGNGADFNCTTDDDARRVGKKIIEKMPDNENNHLYTPQYNKTTHEYNVGIEMDVRIEYRYQKNGTQHCYSGSLVEWVEWLQNKH